MNNSFLADVVGLFIAVIVSLGKSIRQTRNYSKTASKLKLSMLHRWHSWMVMAGKGTGEDRYPNKSFRSLKSAHTWQACYFSRSSTGTTETTSLRICPRSKTHLESAHTSQASYFSRGSTATTETTSLRICPRSRTHQEKARAGALRWPGLIVVQITSHS